MIFNVPMPPPDALNSASPHQDVPAQDRRAELYEWRMRALELTAERGLEQLDDLRRQALEGSYQGDPALAYSRISRAIRQTVMLHAKFEDEAGKSDEQKKAETAAARAAEAQRAASAEAGRKAHQKRQVKRAVMLAADVESDAAEARGEQARDYADLYVDLHERLDDYDEYSDFGRLAVGAVVANICRVLGIEFDPALWEDEPWAIAEMVEKPKGSPFAEWEPPTPETAPETANDDEADPDDPCADDEDDPYGLAEEDDRPRRRSRSPP